MSLKFRMGLTSFKHVGLFPEQAENWEFIFREVRRLGAGARVLNLFAYTGGASLAARAAGADVTHVDSVKPVVSWGRRYDGIVLDPPAYGRGAAGEKWVLEEHINEMLSLCGELLSARGSFLVLNLYSMGLSALLARTAVRQLVGECSSVQFGELYFSDPFGKSLPLGVYYRMSRL